MDVTRRKLLRSGLAVGCSLAASPLITPVTLAAVPGDARLVVIVLRGAMDGLDVVRPVGDVDFKTLRPSATDHGPALDTRFALHPELAPLAPWWQRGELAFAHAVSTPYRDRRSHFDGQDALENGSAATNGALTPEADGWLNRALAGLPDVRSETGFAVGHETLLLLRGDQPVSTWAPDADLHLSPQAQALLRKIYAGDPLFAAAHAQAAALSEATDAAEMSARQARRGEALARFSAARLREETRVAAFSLGGWDTHARQAPALARALRDLVSALTTLKTDLGADWSRTVVMAVTEFGRTARENGSQGTDHGTGGAALFAGGALAGGRVITDWPGLSDAALYEGRDLMPTRDLRALAAWVLRDHMGIAASHLDRVVFPGLEMGSSPRLIA
ncbi:DUF1501 domain-containing protein [Dinoroseobacter sp. PD6]|uniref:DUF1501 domain-containing protein n=1 Tax=Dinoroseobacter sp. PD6 TaxID=3028384 RepID=UPI00237B5385|nr:DUF1501 domain-containing protein [Dinoroseobacter sp. PD6]MDD9716398.1 DUF1501 domain-containing protein [Dinoroseobacter sp. PD6]